MDKDYCIIDAPPKYESGELFYGLPHEKSKEERFQEFVRQNPKFIQWLIDKALVDKMLGRRGSMKRYFEEARDDKTIDYNGPYRLNNDFTSLMARYLMDREPGLAGFFETRELSDPTRKVPVKR